jgi:hypothetical protein
MQLSFIALLCTFWLIEFGLLKYNSQRVEQPKLCTFYAPKVTAIFVYWLMALVGYGVVIFRMQKEPLYDWYYDTAATQFLVVWAAICAVLYLAYLLWLLCRSLTVVRTFRPGERYLFALHLLVLVATGLGIAAGGVYGYEVQDAFQLMFFNALFNCYVYLLAYMYTPLAYHDLDGGDAESGLPAGVAAVTQVDGEHPAADGVHDADGERGADKPAERDAFDDDEGDDDEDGEGGRGNAHHAGTEELHADEHRLEPPAAVRTAGRGRGAAGEARPAAAQPRSSAAPLDLLVSDSEAAQSALTAAALAAAPAPAPSLAVVARRLGLDVVADAPHHGGEALAVAAAAAAEAGAGGGDGGAAVGAPQADAAGAFWEVLQSAGVSAGSAASGAHTQTQVGDSDAAAAAEQQPGAGTGVAADAVSVAIDEGQGHDPFG